MPSRWRSSIVAGQPQVQRYGTPQGSVDLTAQSCQQLLCD
jgi:hypothetical protein